jgi:hypothetical protein
MSCDNVAGKLLNLGRVFYRIPEQLCRRFTVFYRNDLQKKDFEGGKHPPVLPVFLSENLSF